MPGISLGKHIEFYNQVDPHFSLLKKHLTGLFQLLAGNAGSLSNAEACGRTDGDHA